MASVKIYRPTKNAMQSGRGNTKRWLLEFEPARGKFIDPLMGWTGSDDTRNQIRLWFGTKEEAIAYAERKSLEYRVDEPKERTIRPKSYAANYSPDRYRYW